MQKTIATFQIGKQGVTTSSILALKRLFNNHRNVKVSVLRSARGEGKEAKEVVKKTADELLEHLGKNFTAKVIGFTIILQKWRRAVRE